MKKIIINSIITCCILGTVIQIHAQGYIIPDGITMNPDQGFGPEVHIELVSPSGSADFSFTPTSYFTPNVFDVNIVLLSGVLIFSVQENDPFTLQGIQSGDYTELTQGDPWSTFSITCDVGVPFYLGFYTGWPQMSASGWTGTYNDPVLYQVAFKHLIT